MAKSSLKIRVAGTQDTMSPDGYISVVDQIIVSQTGLDDFSDTQTAHNKARTQKLIKYATTRANGSSTLAEISQLAFDGTIETATEDNLRVRANKDERKQTANGRNKVTIALPEEAIDVGTADYIDKFIEKFMDEWTGNAGYTLPASTVGQMARARKFMFGAMLLTRCR